MITNQYTYNGDGQRVQIVDSQGTKKPIWDGENILLETDGAGVTQVVYTLEPAGYGNLVSQRRGSTTSVFLFDALGSTRKLVNTSGGVTDSYDYRAYGETYAASGATVNVFRWVGEVGYYFDVDRDAYYLRARPYSPGIARFLSQDPIGFEGSRWNLFEYTSSRPVVVVDPSGKVEPITICIGIAIGVGFMCGCRKVPAPITPKPNLGPDAPCPGNSNACCQDGPDDPYRMPNPPSTAAGPGCWACNKRYGQHAKEKCSACCTKKLKGNPLKVCLAFCQ